MLNPLHSFYLQWSESLKSTYTILREIILEFDNNITEHWKYSCPFFYYKGKPFCYLWYDKKIEEPYIGIVKGAQLNHFALEQGSRKSMQILRINPNDEIPVDLINEVLGMALELQKH